MSELQRLKPNWKGNVHQRGNAADRSPESVAMVLRNARILQGYDLNEIANSLNIRAAHLEALEDGRFADLPPLVYAQGFVAAYATFLELDKGELISRFRDEASGAPAQQALPTIAPFNLNTEPDAAERRIPSVAVIVTGFVLVALAYGLWQAALPDRRDEVLAVPPLPSRFAAEAFANMPAPVANVVTPAPVIAAAPEGAQVVYATPLPTAQPAPAAYTGAGVITLRAHGDAAAQFYNPQGQRVSSLMMRAGRSYSIPASYVDYSMQLDNMANVTVVLDGRAVAQNGSGAHGGNVALNATRIASGRAILN